MLEFSQLADKSNAFGLFPAASAWAGPLVGTIGDAGSVYLKTYAACQQELARFFGARVEADIALQKALGECRSLSEMLKLQQEWAATAVNDYVNETGRMADIALRATQATTPLPAAAEPAIRSRAAS